MILDLRYAVRTLLKSPGFTLVAMLTLALGIGANTAIFSAVDAVLLHPLPFHNPGELVGITKDMPMFGLSTSVASALDFYDYRSSAKAFSDMAAIGRDSFNLTGEREPQRVPGMRVSASLFRLLDVTPFLGRPFTQEEEQWGRHRVVILGEPLWNSRYGSNPGVVGTQIQIEGESFTVVGVAHPMLQFVSEAQLWVPLAFSPEQLEPNSRGRQFLGVVGRMKPGVSLAQANADLRAVAAGMTERLSSWYPKGWSINAEPLSDTVSGPIRAPLLILTAAVALVLLIGCANVTNLLLARASARQKEIGIRAALGAGSSRIVRQLLVESGVLAVLAGAAGLLIAVVAMNLFSRFGPQGLLRGQHLEVSPWIGAFTALLSLATVLLFGLAPALTARRVNLNDALNSTTRTGASLEKRRLRELLIGAEVALSLVLLISAGLLVRSFVQLQQANPGFSASQVLTAQLNLPVVEYSTSESKSRFYGQLLERIGSLPGVDHAGATNSLPLSGSNRGGSFDIIGRTWGQNEIVPDVGQRSIMPGYFDAMRIPLLRGRVITDRDGWSAVKVAVVDEPFSRQFFAGDPIGKQISGPDPSGAYKGVYTIVGVVGGIKHSSLSSPPAPTIYYPQLQAPSPAMTIIVRSNQRDPLNLAPAIQAEVARLNPNLPLYRVATLEQVMANSLERARFSTTLLGAFALLALLLAAIGIYGVVAYTVSRRTREIGIRMALGARSADALRLVLGQAMIPILAGVAIGLAASFGASRVLSTQLYGVSVNDPLTFLAVSLFLAAIATAACYFPARRATQVDPVTALRYE